MLLFSVDRVCFSLFSFLPFPFLVLYVFLFLFVFIPFYRCYVPSAVLPYVNTNDEKWASEIRRITVLFVNLGLKESDLNAISKDNNKKGGDDIGIVQKVLNAVQVAVYRYEGSLNKFLMDDKGSTLIAVMGLPPLAHEDDPARGVLAANQIIKSLTKFGLEPAIGITTGMSFFFLSHASSWFSGCVAFSHVLFTAFFFSLVISLFLPSYLL